MGSRCGEQAVQSQTRPEEARSNRVQRQAEQLGNLRIAQLLELTQQQNFAVQRIELPDRMAHQHLRFNGGLWCRLVTGRLLAQKRSPKRGFAAMSAQDFKADRKS